MVYISAYSCVLPNYISKTVQVFIENKIICKWTYAVETRVIQGSAIYHIVLIFTLQYLNELYLDFKIKGIDF